MDSVGRRLRKVRINTGMSQVEFAKAIGVSKQTLYKYENDIITNIPSDKIEAAARIANVSPAFIMNWTDEETYPSYPNVHPVGTKRFPVLSSVACGEPILMQEERDLYIDASAEIKADYVLIAKGDSMIGARIHDGDVVFVRSQPTVENGEIAVVAIDDEATLKRVYKYGDLLVLRPDNPEFKEMEYRPGDGHDVRILGKAVAFQSYIV